jgi:hypothetical protein
MPPQKQSKTQADLDLETVTSQAERIGLEDKDKDDFIHKLMTGFGYKAKRTYYQDEPETGGGGGGGFFSRPSSSGDDSDSSGIF